MAEFEYEDELTPIRLYLEREYAEEFRVILGYLVFAGTEEGLFLYRNRITRSLIIVDREGKLVSCGKDALHTIAIYKTFFPKRKYRRKQFRA
ncbi:hypothetical protein [Paenibacillus soyae]|uniref:Uncharacterized protein n=1 Tax=Paenibacillus soyae TaxID=2969249 RepID=A0A9X2S8E9_9BACL|nr:hypothetical protein [Paenibacillus soyae]MCR2804155.1 hypothetical protein [Paenibacillus soyae]